MEFCTECGIGLSNVERQVGYCRNCHCDFNEDIMEQGQIAEGNKSIAKFMGGFQRDRNGTQVWDHAEYTSPLAGGKYVFTYELQYHSSWSWLMPVVEKIENITQGGRYLYCFEMGKDWCSVTNNDFEGKTIVTASINKNKILSVFQCVIKFIQWYNKNKNP